MTAPRGVHWWGGETHAVAGATFVAIEAATGAPLAPEFGDASAENVATAAACAGAAAADFAATTPAVRAALLRGIADDLLGLGEPLLLRAHAETALPMPRLVAERGRTVMQLRMFADGIEEGSWVDARIDHGDPARQPQPKPDLRAMLVPLGPVAVFGASNFPFAYSVAGGDTASALAAGCPVLVKAHPAHPGTSALVAEAIVAAVARAGLPAGVFGMVHGRGHEVGGVLVSDPHIAAVGFTGSVAGGSALCALAANRPAPIPVFAEMGSVNPVFVLGEALRQRGDAIAAMVANSALQACGQFCTSPGMVLVEAGPAAQQFVAALQQRIGDAPAGTLVHPTIRAAFERSKEEVLRLPGVTVGAVAAQVPACAATGAQPLLLVADADAVLTYGRLREEIYGPALVVVRCRAAADLERIAAALHGHLTATVHGTAADLQRHRQLLFVLRRKVGRLIHDGVPTGVEVTTAMQHGGPWPASSDARFTAVGPRALLRWVRPLCFQDAPAEALPEELRDGNPRGLWRTVDGVLGRH